MTDPKMTDQIDPVALPGEPDYVLTRRAATGAQLPGFASGTCRKRYQRVNVVLSEGVRPLTRINGPGNLGRQTRGRSA